MLTASSVVCTRCPLACAGRKSIVDGAGAVPARLMCIAEAPGRDEDKAAMPLIGVSGKLLRSTLAEICAYYGVDAKQIFYTNVCRCRPPDNRTPTQQEVDACLPWLQEELDEVQPVCILALGRTAQDAIRNLDLSRSDSVDGQERARQKILSDTQGTSLHIWQGSMAEDQRRSRSESSTKEKFSEGESSQSRMVSEFERQQTLYGLWSGLPVLRNAMGSCGSENVEQTVSGSSPYGDEPRSDVEGTGELRTGVRQLSCKTDMGTGTASVVNARHPAFILRRRSELESWRNDLIAAVKIAFGIETEDTPLIDIAPVEEQPETDQFKWGEPEPDAPYLAVDSEYDDLEEHVGTQAVGWSVSDGNSAIFYSFQDKQPPQYPHVDVHRADADLENMGIDPDNLDAYDDTMLKAYPLQQRYGWPYLGLKRPDGKGLAQVVVDPPVVWKHMLKSDLLRVYVPSGTVFKSGPRKGLEKPGKWRKDVQFSEVLQSRKAEAEEYGATDAYGTSRLAQTLDGLLNQNPWARRYYEQVEKPLIPVLLQMERTGIQIDVDKLNEAGDVINAKRALTEASLRETFGSINPGSNQQMGPVLLEMGLVDGKLTETGGIGVAEKNILGAFAVDDASQLPQTNEGQIARTLLDWREMGKLRSTYVEAIKNRLDPTSRIHPRFNATGTYTSRLSSSDPNAQNIPARTEIGMAIRRAFVAGPGRVFAGGDCSQFQLRIFGELTHDPIFLDAYVNCELRGCPPLCKCPLCDLHQKFTDLVNSWGYHVERSSHTGGPSMKNGVFATLYGVAGKKLANTIGIPEADADKFLRQMKDFAPAIVTWPEVAAQELSSQGYIETPLGWRMYFPDFGSVVDKWHKEAIRQAACGKVQGTEGGMIKVAMRRVYENLRRYYPEWRLLLQVHDEFWGEGPEDQAHEVQQMMKETVEQTMTPWMKTVPVVFDAKVISNWAEGK